MANKPEVSNRFLARWGREAILFYTIELNCTQRARDCYASLALAGWFAMQVNTVEETYIYNLSSSSSSSNVQFLLAIAKKIDSIFFLLQIIRKECETCAERSAKCRIKSKLSGRQDLTKERTSNTRKTVYRRRTSSVSQYYNRVITLFSKRNHLFFLFASTSPTRHAGLLFIRTLLAAIKSFFFFSSTWRKSHGKVCIFSLF
jgi:hypothetical protein